MSTETFDPMRDVPKTDEQAETALVRDDDLLTRSLRGIYRTHRAQGKSVVEAFEAALLAHVAAHTEAMREKGASNA